MTDLERSVRVGLVVDEALSRASLTDVLSADPRLNVVHSIGGCEEARVLFRPQSLDVVVVDAELQDGNGVALSVLLQRDDPRLAVLLLSSRDATDLVLSVRMAGVTPVEPPVAARLCGHGDAGARGGGYGTRAGGAGPRPVPAGAGAGR